MNGKQLKNSILQWAIQGKLVPQDPNDEPASVLLERIREEKARLVKEKKIKKDKNESIIFRGDDNSHYEKFADGTVKCIDDEIPFEIPQSWCWCRMREVIQFINGRAYKKEELLSNGKYKVLRVGNFFTNNSWYYSDLELQEDKYCNNGDLLYAWSASFGPKIWKGDKTIFHYHIWNLKYSEILFRDYLYYYLLFDKTQVKKSTTGSTMIHVSMENMNPRLIPIPPINEQRRIVTKIESVIPIVDKYETSQILLNQLNTEIFDKLKKSVLQEAIQGKLVPQDPNDEPASVLLERIKEEKTKLFKEGKLKKKDLVDSVIFKGEDNKYYEKIGSEVTCIDDEIPFEIPDSWAWIRLGNIFQHNTGKALNGSNQKGVFYDYITTSNLYWNSFVLGKLRSMPFTDDELDKCTVKKGDLLVCEGGDIGRSAIWNYDYDIRIQNHIHRLRAYTPICTMFIYYTLYLYKHTGLIGGKGIGIQGLSSNALHKLLLPLPSIAEQKRIVDKIEFVIASITRR